jgi:hypothetical protein
VIFFNQILNWRGRIFSPEWKKLIEMKAIKIKALCLKYRLKRVCNMLTKVQNDIMFNLIIIFFYIS